MTDPVTVTADELLLPSVDSSTESNIVTYETHASRAHAKLLRSNYQGRFLVTDHFLVPESPNSYVCEKVGDKILYIRVHDFDTMRRASSGPCGEDPCYHELKFIKHTTYLCVPRSIHVDIQCLPSVINDLINEYAKEWWDKPLTSLFPSAGI